MKKLFLVGALALFGAMNAQTGFKLGANIGLPTGDLSSVYSFTAGVDASYLWPVSAEFNLGVASGFQTYFPKSEWKDLGVKNTNLVPLAASAQYKVSPQFSVGADLGYGFVFYDGESDGGFYYAPKVAYHFGTSEVNLSYRGVSQDGSSANSINLGYAYSFGK